MKIIAVQEGILFGKPRWMFQSVFGSDYVNKAVAEGKTIDQFMNDAKQMFRVLEGDRLHILSGRNSFVLGQDNRFKDISNLYAFNLYGIEYMETACEKTRADISVKIVIPKLRAIKLGKI